MPSISIIVPSYNQGHLIAHTLDSILGQGLSELDVFVVDGGSTDQTVEVLRSYGNRIRWVSERDRGQTEAINKGMRQATGDIVAYINSDDTYEPGTVRKALDLFERNPDVDFIYGDANFVDAQGRLIQATQAVDFDIEILTYDHNFICQPAAFWRRSIAERVGPFDESLYYYMDYEYFLRLAHSGARFMHVREAWCNLRLHVNCKTVAGINTNKESMHQERRDMLDRYRRRFGSNWLTSRVHFALKWSYRGKKLVKDILENGKLPFFGHRALMRRMHSLQE